jgi:hypothetical protein
MAMTRRDHIAVAEVIRDADIERHRRRALADQMADRLDGISPRFDRAMFMAFATSDPSEEQRG